MSSRYEKMLNAIANGETITDEPICRRERYLKALANKEGDANLPEPICREEEFYKSIIKGEQITAEPLCRKEAYLKAIANNEPMPTFSGSSCGEENILKKICSSGISGGGTTPTPPTYSVTFGTGVTVLNGSTKITSGTKVTSGTILKVSYTLSEHYHLVSFKVNGTEVANNSTITVKSNVTITFTQEIDTYAVTFNEGVSVLNGETSLTSGDKVPYGTSLIARYTLSEHYHKATFRANGEDIENNSTIVITRATEIIFTQAIDTYSVTFGAGVSVLNGTTSLTSGDKVPYGTNLVVSYTLTDGYKLTSFQVNGSDTENNSTIQVRTNIEITFAEEEESTGGGSSLTFSRILSENTPAQISAVSAEISANNMTSSQVESTYGWKIGDTITIPRTTGDTIEVRIDGYNHDNLSDGSGKVGISLEMTHCLPTPHALNPDYADGITYQNCELRTKYFQEIKSTLPQEWQEVIKFVDKKSANGDIRHYTGTITTSDDLFLLSEIEVLGAVQNAIAGENEGAVYEYYKNNNANNFRIKKYDSNSDGVVDTAYYWWLRSYSSQGNNLFVSIKSDGSIGQGTSYIADVLYVSVGFCV